MNRVIGTQVISQVVIFLARVIVTDTSNDLNTSCSVVKVALGNKEHTNE